MAVPVQLVSEPSDVLVGLRPQRGRDHPTSPLASELVERNRDLLAGLHDRQRANIHHWRAFLSPPIGAGSVLIKPGRYAAFVLKVIHNFWVYSSCPNAEECLDPFHVVKLATDALDEVRREVWNDARSGGQAGLARELKAPASRCGRTPSDSSSATSKRSARVQEINKHLYRAYLPC